MALHSNSNSNSNSNQDDIFRDVLLASIKEQRLSRRWGILFKSLFFILIFSAIFMIWVAGGDDGKADGEKYAAVVDIRGVIGAGGNVSADDVNSALDEAFRDPKTQGIILRINSPGGSPVEASEIYNEIFRLRAKHPDTKVYAVCTDMCTSAAYYIASAANNIYANKASLVGSIGVLIEGFGFVDTMQKLGVQRRLLMSGDRKGFLDPFSPLSAKDQAVAQGMLNQIHEQFIQDVEKGRGTRLKTNQEMFSGVPWTGAQAVGLGLIDGFASAADVARNVIQTKHLKDFTRRADLLDQLAQKFGASMVVKVGELFGLEQGVREQTGI